MIPQITQSNLSHVIFAINLTNHILTKQQQQQNLPENIKLNPVSTSFAHHYTESALNLMLSADVRHFPASSNNPDGAVNKSARAPLIP